MVNVISDILEHWYEMCNAIAVVIIAAIDKD